MAFNNGKGLSSTGEMTLSIVIPTYNEAQNILNLINKVKEKLSCIGEIIIVDDNSPDGTGEIVENYIHSRKTLELSDQHQENRPITANVSVKIVHQEKKTGLIPAIVKGIEYSFGQNILVMDADFSHPPEAIPQIIDKLREDPSCVVVASRYVQGGSIAGWNHRRRIVSNTASQIARFGLNMRDVKDPLSGYFAFPRHVIENVRFDTKGYKILLELLVKRDENINIREIPYAFSNRTAGASKLDSEVIFEYVAAVWRLYMYGRKAKFMTQAGGEKRNSVLFLSKAARFFTVGATGLVINLVVSFFLSNGVLSNIWYINASIVGIIVSISSNFILNKAWTFEDRDFSPRHALKQYGLFLGSSSVAAVIQLLLVYIFVESYHVEYGISLILSVALASIGNFLLNKKVTFKEKIWG